MKKIFALTATVFTVIAALTAQAEEAVTEEIFALRAWEANKVSGHTAWNKEACVASTLFAGEAALEVYAEKTGEIFAEPTVQVLVKENQQIYAAVANTETNVKFSLTLANEAADPGVQVVMARLGDRERLVDQLRRANTLTVRLQDAKGKTIRMVQFSLSGSSKTIEAQFKACGLAFEPIQ